MVSSPSETQLTIECGKAGYISSYNSIIKFHKGREPSVTDFSRRRVANRLKLDLEFIDQEPVNEIRIVFVFVIRWL